MTRLFDIDPHEEISQAGYFWTPIHYACHFKRTEILEYLLGIAYRKHPDTYE